jgi:hypothetical protein
MNEWHACPSKQINQQVIGENLDDQQTEKRVLKQART